MRWSPQQDDALTAVERWLRNPNGQKVFRLFGYAGTGKTEIAAEIGRNRRGTHFASLTGKATHVMRQRGCEPVSTIHRLIYTTTVDPDTGQYLHDLKSRDDLHDLRLLVIDECSMVDHKLGADLLSFEIPVLTIGDPEQLPSVKGADFFMDAEPDVMLTDIHRQARESPIIRLADETRRGLRLPKRGFRDGDVVVTDMASIDPEDFDVVLVGTNATRCQFNDLIRRRLGFRDRIPQCDETLVCLRNDYRVNEPVFNGALFQVRAVQEVSHHGIASVDLVLGSKYNGNSRVLVPQTSFLKGLPPAHFNGFQSFDFGYALTVHKAQGSEWPNVLLIDEGRMFPGQARRWRYTGITRAQEALTIVI